jgi:hypothetical protein
VQSGKDFDDNAETQAEVSENSVGEAKFRASCVYARQNWPVAARWKASALKPGLEHRARQFPGVGAAVNQN